MLKIISLHVFLIPLLVFWIVKCSPENGGYLITEIYYLMFGTFVLHAFQFVCLVLTWHGWSLRKSGRFSNFIVFSLLKIGRMYSISNDMILCRGSAVGGV